MSEKSNSRFFDVASRLCSKESIGHSSDGEKMSQCLYKKMMLDMRVCVYLVIGLISG